MTTTPDVEGGRVGAWDSPDAVIWGGCGEICGGGKIIVGCCAGTCGDGAVGWRVAGGIVGCGAGGWIDGCWGVDNWGEGGIIAGGRGIVANNNESDIKIRVGGYQLVVLEM